MKKVLWVLLLPIWAILFAISFIFSLVIPFIAYWIGRPSEDLGFKIIDLCGWIWKLKENK